MYRPIATIVIWILCTTAHAADFRGASWGMSLVEVRTLHGGELSANQGRHMIEYEGKLGDMDVLIFYQFDALGRLSQAGYKSDEDHTDKNQHIEDYQNLNALLRRKYPQSTEPAVHWQNRLFEPKPEQWGRAVTLGHLTYRWEYAVERTRIQHLLNGDRRHITHILRYAEIVEQRESAAQTARDVLDEL